MEESMNALRFDALLAILSHGWVPNIYDFNVIFLEIIP